ncbi:hypothetical protein M2275_003149 [Rhodococcus opacus]|nr:hypothetical protein [Rhodococcus opacus]
MTPISQVHAARWSPRSRPCNGEAACDDRLSPPRYPDQRRPTYSDAYLLMKGMIWWRRCLPDVESRPCRRLRAECRIDGSPPGRRAGTPPEWVPQDPHPLRRNHRVVASHREGRCLTPKLLGMSFFARTLAASRIAAVQSSSPALPSRSSTSRCSLSNTPVAAQTVNLRCAVGTVTPNERGRCHHAHPLVSTYTIAVNTPDHPPVHCGLPAAAQRIAESTVRRSPTTHPAPTAVTTYLTRVTL